MKLQLRRVRTPGYVAAGRRGVLQHSRWLRLRERLTTPDRLLHQRDPGLFVSAPNDAIHKHGGQLCYKARMKSRDAAALARDGHHMLDQLCDDKGICGNEREPGGRHRGPILRIYDVSIAT